MIHVGVDIHQRFCYITALEARGKTIRPVRSTRSSWRCGGTSSRLASGALEKLDGRDGPAARPEAAAAHADSDSPSG
jgi:hypothetical protein